MGTHGPTLTKPPSRRVSCQLRESTGRLVSKGAGLPDTRALRVIATDQARVRSRNAPATSITVIGHCPLAAMLELHPT